MRLEELKNALIEQFFKDSKIGVDKDKIYDILVSLRKCLGVPDPKDLSEREAAPEIKFLEKEGSHSNDSTKAFAAFIKGRESTLSIIEEDGIKLRSIFTAARVGKNIYYVDLTDKEYEEKKGDLATIKQALRQAKKINDDVYFSIVHDEREKKVEELIAPRHQMSPSRRKLYLDLKSQIKDMLIEKGKK